MKTLLIFLSALFIVSSAYAYVPPSFFIPKTLAKKHAGLDEGRFRSRVTFYKTNGEPARAIFENLYISPADSVIIRFTDDQGNEVQTISRRIGSQHATDFNSRPITYDLLFVKNSTALFERFSRLGFPMKTETDLYLEKEGTLPYKPENSVQLSRLDGKVTLLFTDPAASRAPKLWIEKDSILPLRYSSPVDSIEYQFSGYQVARSFLYPKYISIFREGKLWAKVELVDVRVGAGASALDPAKGKGDVDGTTRDFIEMYLKWVR